MDQMMKIILTFGVSNRSGRALSGWRFNQLKSFVRLHFVCRYSIEFFFFFRHIFWKRGAISSSKFQTIHITCHLCSCLDFCFRDLSPYENAIIFYRERDKANVYVCVIFDFQDFCLWFQLLVSFWHLIGILRSILRFKFPHIHTCLFCI